MADGWSSSVTGNLHFSALAGGERCRGAPADPQAEALGCRASLVFMMSLVGWELDREAEC